MINPPKRRIESGLRLLFENDSNETLGKLTRYETGLMNILIRTLNLLHWLQQVRNSSHTDECVVLALFCQSATRSG